MGWDVSDMNAAFEGPRSFIGGRMYVAELVGEGNPLASGLICTDTAVMLTLRATSACDEDVWAADISGAGGLSKQGVGKLSLAGTNTFLGGVMLEDGTLGIASESSLGTGLVTFSGGTLAFDASFDLSANRQLVIDSGSDAAFDTNGHDVSILGNIRGTGRLQKSGSGRLKLAGTGTFTSVDLMGGVFEVDADSNLGATGGQLTFSGATLAFGAEFAPAAARNIMLNTFGAIDTNGFNINIRSAIAGSGDLIKLGEGALGLMGTSSYTGNTQVIGGQLASDISAIKGDLYSGPGTTVVISQSADASFGGDISGAGTIRKASGHDLTLQGRSSAAKWEISGGNLISEQEFSGDIAFTGSGSPTFDFAQDENSEQSLTGVFSGSGEIRKSGSGMLVLTGDSSSFAGQFSVSGNSTVLVDGQLGGMVNVASGAFGGGGVVNGDVVVARGAKLLPSRTLNTRLVVNGDLDLNGDYEVVFGLGAVVNGQADISATSSAIVLNRLPPFTFSDGDRSKFNILFAEGGLTGRFADVVHPSLPFATVAITYGARNVEIRGGRNAQDLEELINEPPLEPLAQGLTEDGDIQQPIPQGVPQINQNNVLIARIIDQAEANEDEEINYISGLIARLADDPEGKTAVEQMEDAVDQLSGEVHASSKSALLISNTGLRNVAVVQTRAALGSVGTEGALANRFNLRQKQWGFVNPASTDTALWVKFLGAKGINQGGNEYREIRYKGGNLLVGGDGVVYNTRVGFFGGTSNLNFEQGTSAGNVTAGGDDKSKHFGTYFGKGSNWFVLRGGVTYTIHEVTTSRTAIIGTVGINLTASYTAKTTGAFSELGYQIETQDALFEPFIGVNYSLHKVEGFTENSVDGNVPMNMQENKTSMAAMEVGIHAMTELPYLLKYLPRKSVLSGMLSWNISLKDPDIIVPQSIGNSQAVDIRGTPLSTDGFALQAGIEFDLADKTSLLLRTNYAKLSATGSNKKYSFEGKLTHSF